MSAVDKSGNPFPELSKDELSVSEDQHAGQIVDVHSADQLPLRLGIVLLATQVNFPQQQAAAIELVRKTLRPNIDSAFVVVSGGDNPWRDTRLVWQSDPDALEKTIGALDKNTGLPDAFIYNLSAYQVGPTGHRRVQEYENGGANVFDFVRMMMRFDPKPARRAVVLFRDPWAHSPGFGDVINHAVEDQHLRVIADAQRLWTSFYIIGLEQPTINVPLGLNKSYVPIQAGSDGFNREYDERLERSRERAYSGGQANLERMAKQTGGGVWWSAKKNYPDAVAGIVNRLNAAYAVTYSVPVIPGGGTVHSPQLKATSPAIRLSTQMTYFSRQAPPPPPPTSTLQGATPSVR